MPPKRKTKKKKTASSSAKKLDIRDAHLPGYLMIAFGLLGLGINYDLLAGMTWAKAYPLLAVLFGAVALVKVIIANED
jgi:hypothetical protein